MHFGVPVVPDEYMIYKGWLNGKGSKFRFKGSSSANVGPRNLDKKILKNKIYIKK